MVITMSRAVLGNRGDVTTDQTKHLVIPEKGETIAEGV